jgi:hypothetical protein
LSALARLFFNVFSADTIDALTSPLNTLNILDDDDDDDDDDTGTVLVLLACFAQTFVKSLQ